MAIDATIPLMTHSPDYAQTIAGIYAAQQAKQQVQEGRQRLTLGDLQVQQARQAAADEAQTRTTIARHYGGVQSAAGAPTDASMPGGAPATAGAAPVAGSSPSSGMQGTIGDLLSQGLIGPAATMQKQQMEQDKAAGELQKSQIETHIKQVGLLGQLANGITDQTSYTANVNKALQLGLVQPGEFPSVYDPELVRRAQNNAITAQEHLTNLQKQMLADETGRHNRALEQQAQAQQADIAKYHAGELQMRGREIGIQGARLQLERSKANIDNAYLPSAGAGQTGNAYLQNLSPGVQAQVKAIANGDIAIPPPGARSQSAQALRQAVLTFDPSYTDARYATKQSFKTKGDAGSIVGLATTMEHLDRLKTNSDKVGFAPLIDSGLTTESAAYGNDAKLFAQEAGKLIKSGVVTEGEYKDLKAGLMSSRASIRNASIQELSDLMGGKVSGLFQKYKTGSGQDLPVGEFFDKSTQGRLQRFGVVQGVAQSAQTATHVYNPHTGKIEAIQ